MLGFFTCVRAMALLGLALSATAADPPETGGARVPRKTLRIAGQWNLTAEKHENTETDGTRTKILTSSGKATLKRGPNMIRGPWNVDAKADVIECDFVGKKFILSGSPFLQKKDPAGKTTQTITGQPEAVVEIDFAGGPVHVRGPHTTKIADAAAPLNPAPAKDAPAGVTSPVSDDRK